MEGGRIAITGLSKSVDDIRGPIDVYDDGLLTRRFDAVLAGTRVQISGGIYGLRDPRLRVAVRGSGEAAQLRSAFEQARRLPVAGRLSFGLLVEGTPSKPITWIDVNAPHVTYASNAIDRVSGLIAFDGRAADVLGVSAAYRGIELSARGRAGFTREPGAIAMLLAINAPPGGVPYAGNLLPRVPLRAVALATADDPKAIALQGGFWGIGAAQELNGVFNVSSRGTGTIGPIHITSGQSTLYARVALDRSHDTAFGLATARNYPIAPAHAVLNATAIGAQTKSGITAGVAGSLASAWATVNARGNVALSGGRLRGSLVGDAGRKGSFGATVAGTPASPRVAGTLVVAGERYRNFEVNGNAGMAYAGGTLRLQDTAVAVGPLFLGIAGSVADLASQGGFAPRYDLTAQLHSSDAGALVAAVQPRAASLVQGSIDADVRVRGTGNVPSVSGTVSAPEGSVNGLPFRDLRGTVRGNLTAASIGAGRVSVGDTAVGFHADRVRDRTSVAVDAPQAELADFNDFFDAGDMLGGGGRIAAQATFDGTHVLATNGAAQLSNARYLRLDLGSVDARWRTSGRAVATTLSMGGPTGQLYVNGSVTPATMSANLRANAHAIDLGTWLPMLGLNVPITGRLDARTTLSGRYPDMAMDLRAAVLGGTAGHLTIERFEIAASGVHGRGRVTSAILEVPSLTTTATGTFGLRETDSLALVAHSTSSDIGAFLREAIGKDARVGGTLDSTLRLEGTRAAPRLRDDVTLASVRYGNLTIPRVAATVEADRHAVRVMGGEVDLARGRALLSAVVPIESSSKGVRVGGAPISASLRADDVELSNFGPLLPKGTTTAGRIDGTITARGTLESPLLDGALQLRNGAFSGPIERVPVTGILADLSLAGHEARLQARAAAGGGALGVDGSATLASLRNAAGSAVTLRATAAGAKLDLPNYFQGLFDANIALERAPFATPRVSGSVSISNARIPLNAFLNQSSGGGTRPALPNVAFDGVRIGAGSNVRVQSRNVDIGATGEIALNGTLAAPALTGEFRSTGGTLSFYRNFSLESGTVKFASSSGIIPDVDAVATTYVSDPPTAVRLQVTGPATDMNLVLASDPAYNREQILGLLVGAQQFGAVRGVNSTGGTFSATSAATNVALGQLNTAFTRNLLEPLNSSLAGTMGFSEVRITTDIQTGVGVSAVKAFGKTVSAIFSQTFGYPKTQSITLEARPSVGTGLRLTAFTSTGPTVLGLSQPQPVGVDVMNLNPLTAVTSVSGTNGVSFSFLRKFP